MFRLLLLAFSVLIFSSSMSSQMRAWFDHKVFYVPNDGPFVETHLHFDGYTLKYTPLDTASHQAQVQATIIVKNDDGIVDFRKNIITSPAVGLKETSDLTDIQRISVPNGDYTFYIELQDVNASDAEPLQLTQDFEVSVPDDKASVSDITLVKAYSPATEPSELTKSGYDMVPYVNNYFPAHLSTMIFYAELYNTEKTFGDGGAFAFSYHIENVETMEVAEGLQKIKKETATSVIPQLQTINIANLPSGDYDLVVSIRNTENTIVAANGLRFTRAAAEKSESSDDLAYIDVSKTFVEGFESRDSLMECTRSLHPISNNLERSTIERQLETADMTLLKQYFYHFWESRDSENPQAAWEAYNIEVMKAQANFGTRIKKGYETDRGRVYLQYGPPNTRVERPFPEQVYPYEIWHYYDIGDQHNKRFLFYDPTVGREDYDLLHSDVVGEIQNFGWKQMMRAGQATTLQSQMGNVSQRGQTSFDESELEDLFYNPR